MYDYFRQVNEQLLRDTYDSIGNAIDAAMMDFYFLRAKPLKIQDSRGVEVLTYDRLLWIYGTCVRPTLAPYNIPLASDSTVQ
jgi:hypothetical protein